MFWLVPLRAGNWNNTFRAGSGYLNLNNVRTNSNNNVSVRDLENSFCLRALSMIRMNSLRDFCRWFKKPEIKKDSSFCGNKCEAQTENKNKREIR